MISAIQHTRYSVHIYHLPLPTWGAMASASGHGVFLKNLSVSLVQLKAKRKQFTTPKQERLRTQTLNSEHRRYHRNKPEPSKSMTLLNPALLFGPQQCGNRVQVLFTDPTGLWSFAHTPSSQNFRKILPISSLADLPFIQQSLLSTTLELGLWSHWEVVQFRN